ncbi:hypothetical protein, partial [Tropheryma whipplei]|uniref:hypothetical protein n=1 Tax=Tropheryma whipplei TaxID=2039 RepID=UPI0019D3F84E
DRAHATHTFHTQNYQEQYPRLTKKANLSFLKSTKDGLTKINGWVTGITGPVNTYIDKIRDWGSRSAQKPPEHPLKSVTAKIKTEKVNTDQVNPDLFDPWDIRPVCWL